MLANTKNKIYIIVVFVLCLIIAGLFIFDRYQVQQKAKQYKQEAPVSTIESSTQKKLDPVYCIGDSLTLGAANQTSYPEYLKQNIDNSVSTIADKNINSAALAIKLNTLNVYVNNMTIPADTTEVSITLLDDKGANQNAIVQSQTNIDNCSIEGIAGSISYNAQNKNLVFKRKSKGESIKITKLTQVQIEKPEIKDNGIVILYTGSYEQSIGGSLITYQQDIIKAFNTDKYIVVSLTQNDRNETNNLLKETYGNHYLDFKSYLLEKGLSDASIKATSQDQQNIANKNVPASLLADELNGNSQYNELLAKQIISKMQELGYLQK